MFAQLNVEATHSRLKCQTKVVFQRLSIKRADAVPTVLTPKLGKPHNTKQPY